jgi:hypothetical protein
MPWEPRREPLLQTNVRAGSSAESDYVSRMSGTFRVGSSRPPYGFFELPRLRLPRGFELGCGVNCNIPKCGAVCTATGDYVMVPDGEVAAGPHLIFHCPRCDEDFTVAAPRWSEQLVNRRSQ